jgi:hypothetical protein
LKKIKGLWIGDSQIKVKFVNIALTPRALHKREIPQIEAPGLGFLAKNKAHRITRQKQAKKQNRGLDKTFSQKIFGSFFHNFSTPYRVTHFGVYRRSLGLGDFLFVYVGKHRKCGDKYNGQ